MLERRRSSYGRAIVGGAILGVTAAVPLVIFELVAVLVAGTPTLAGPEQAFFYLVLLTLPVFAGALVGLVEGVLLNSAALLTERLATQRLAQPRWMARISCVMISPAIAFFVAELFSSDGVGSNLPARDLIALGIGVFGVLVVYLLARLVVFVRDRFRIRRWNGRQARLLVPALLLISLFFFLVDRGIFGRFSIAIHGLLLVSSALAAQLAMATIYSAWRPKSSVMGRLFEPRLVTMILVASISLGALGLSRVRRSEPLRASVLRYTAVQSKLVSFSSGIGLVPAAPVVKKSASK
jgi:MFS family permease